MAETRQPSLTALLEDLLSMESLSRDQAINGDMDWQLQVPAAVLAGHPLVVNADFAAAGPPVTVADVLAAAAQSKKLQVNGQSVKPQLKLCRNVLVVTEVPASVDRAEVEALVKSAAKVTVKEVRLEAPGAWFVKLEDEEHCRRAAVGLRERVWACGEPVVAAIKAVHVRRGYCDPVTASAGTAWGGASLGRRTAELSRSHEEAETRP